MIPQISEHWVVQLVFSFVKLFFYVIIPVGALGVTKKLWKL